MTTKQAINWVGTQEGYNATHYALARFLGITATAVYNWDKRPPVRRQYELQDMSNGALKVTK